MGTDGAKQGFAPGALALCFAVTKGRGVGFKHHHVHHQENEFACGQRHIQGSKLFWSFAKTRLAKRRGGRVNKFTLHLKESECIGVTVVITSAHCS